MRPELFNLFDVSFPAYFVLLIVGFAFAVGVGAMVARRSGQDPDVIVDLGLAALLLGVIGGRVFHVLFDGYFMDYVHLCTDPTLVDWKVSRGECLSERYLGVWDAAKAVCHPKEADCFAWAKFWAGGLVYYGGLAFAIPGCVWLLKRDRFPAWKGADVAGLTIPLGLGFGRMGCLLAGCCFGVRDDGPLALSFPPHSPAALEQFDAGLLGNKSLPSLPVHPAQIYEAAACLAITAFGLLWLMPRKRYDGQLLLSFLGLYAIARFVLEYWRADDRGALLGLSTSQWISVIALGAVIAVHRLRMRTVAAE